MSDKIQPALSAEEWAERWGVCIKTALSRLKQALRAGLLVAGRRPSMGVSGRASWTPIYAIRKPPSAGPPTASGSPAGATSSGEC